MGNLPQQSHDCHTITSKRLRNRDAFLEEILKFRSHFSTNIDRESQAIATQINGTSNNLKVVVRIRPLNEKESDMGEYCVLSQKRKDETLSQTQKPSVYLHRGGFRLNGKNMYMEHHKYNFNAVYDAKYKSSDIYRDVVYDLVLKGAVPNIDTGTEFAVIMFGQTGSGKTYTMETIFKLVAEDLFKAKDAKTSVSFSCFEVSGESVLNLQKGKTEFDLRCDSTGKLHFEDIATVVSNASELSELYCEANQLRETFATGVHDTSSRTHAVYRVIMTFESLKSDENIVKVFTLADLAGSEWTKDQEKHTIERRNESKSINYSLMTLKQCMRERCVSKSISPSIRQSKLCRILQTHLTKSDSNTIVIGTISPSCSDTDHSMATLHHLSQIYEAKFKESITEASLEPNWDRSGVETITTTVAGEAKFDFDTSQNGFTSLIKMTSSASIYSSTKFDVERSRSHLNYKSKKPRDWSPTDVCEWYVDAATQAFDIVSKDFENLSDWTQAHIDDQKPLMLSFSVLDVVENRMDGSLGVSFTKMPANLDKIQCNYPVIASVGQYGMIEKLKLDDTTKAIKGCLLVGVGTDMFDNSMKYSECLKKLKFTVKAFKECIKDRYEWKRQVVEATRPRVHELTPEMARMRAYVTGQSIDDLLKEAADKARSWKPTTPPPEPVICDDLVILLKTGPPQPPKMPKVPIIFTGQSRLGVAAGKLLVEKFGCDNFHNSKFLASVSDKGSEQIAQEMWNSLRGLL